MQENGFTLPDASIAAGTDLSATLINCFVQPVGDSIVEVVDDRPGIYTALPKRLKPCAAWRWVTTSSARRPR